MTNEPDTGPLSEADVLASIGGWRIGCEIEQENRYIVSKCDVAGYLAIRKHYAPVTPEGDPAWQLTDIGLRRLASIGTSEQFCDAVNMRDWYRANASKPNPPQSPGLREALVEAGAKAMYEFEPWEDGTTWADMPKYSADAFRETMRFVLAALAAQSPVVPPSGAEEWRCFHCNEVFTDKDAAREHFGFITILEPGCIDPMRGNEKALRRREMQSESLFRKVCDQRDQLFNELKELRALSASIAGEADHCKKCGCELNGEAALVGDEVWCHPCADAAPSPVLPPSGVEALIKHMVNRFLGWKLPENFNPDDGISFEPIAGKDGPFPFRRTPSGTNLFDATQADAMVRYMMEGYEP